MPKMIPLALLVFAMTTGAASAQQRIPNELLGCWKYVEASSGVRNPDSIYRRIDSKDCKGEKLISSDGTVSDYADQGLGKSDCPLRSVISSDTKRGRYSARL